MEEMMQNIKEMMPNTKNKPPKRVPGQNNQRKEALRHIQDVIANSTMKNFFSAKEKQRKSSIKPVGEIARRPETDLLLKTIEAVQNQPVTSEIEKGCSQEDETEEIEVEEEEEYETEEEEEVEDDDDRQEPSIDPERVTSRRQSMSVQKEKTVILSNEEKTEELTVHVQEETLVQEEGFDKDTGLDSSEKSARFSSSFAGLQTPTKAQSQSPAAAEITPKSVDVDSLSVADILRQKNTSRASLTLDVAEESLAQTPAQHSAMNLGKSTSSAHNRSLHPSSARATPMSQIKIGENISSENKDTPSSTTPKMFVPKLSSKMLPMDPPQPSPSAASKGVLTVKGKKDVATPAPSPLAPPNAEGKGGRRTLKGTKLNAGASKKSVVPEQAILQAKENKRQSAMDLQPEFSTSEQQSPMQHNSPIQEHPDFDVDGNDSFMSQDPETEVAPIDPPVKEGRSSITGHTKNVRLSIDSNAPSPVPRSLENMAASSKKKSQKSTPASPKRSRKSVEHQLQWPGEIISPIIDPDQDNRSMRSSRRDSTHSVKFSSPDPESEVEQVESSTKPISSKKNRTGSIKSRLVATPAESISNVSASRLNSLLGAASLEQISDPISPLSTQNISHASDFSEQTGEPLSPFSKQDSSIESADSVSITEALSPNSKHNDSAASVSITEALSPNSKHNNSADISGISVYAVQMSPALPQEATETSVKKTSLSRPMPLKSALKKQKTPSTKKARFVKRLQKRDPVLETPNIKLLREMEGGKTRSSVDGGLRHSKRTKYPVLKWWKSERILYTRTEEQPLPVPQAVHRIEATPQVDRKERKLIAMKKPRDTAAPMPPKELPKGFNYIAGDTAQIWDEEAQDFRERKIVRHASSMKAVALPITGKRKKEQKIVAHGAQAFNLPSIGQTIPGFISGQCFLPPGGIKDPEGVGLCTQVFFVSKCQPDSVEISIARPDSDIFNDETAQRFVLRPGSQLYVPPNNVYRIENHSKHTDALLMWCIIKNIDSEEKEF